MANFIERIINQFRWVYWSRRFGSVKTKINADWKSINIQNPDSLYFGKNVGIGKYTYFLPCKSHLGSKYNPQIIIGDNCWIGIRNSFAAIDRIQIGNNVLFAGYVHITDHSHGYENISLPIRAQTLISKGPVIIENDCWLGFGCEILSGVHIGTHSIVAARAVVTKDVPSYSIVAGNPAKVIKRYNFEIKKWERMKISNE